MNKSHEISKIQNALQIPVNDVVFNLSNVEIISGNKNIGAIPFYNLAGIYTYDNSTEVINWLKWDMVYQQNATLINSLIVELTKSTEIVITLGTFRYLYIKDKADNLLAKINCVYYSSGWSIHEVV